MIRQDTQPRATRAILAAVARIASPVILISGYQRPPGGWNVFFHGPLSESLTQALPDRRFRHLLAYRDTDVFGTWPGA